MSSKKKTIPEMFPVKKWLSRAEAMAYLDLSPNVFTEVAAKNNLTISAIEGKTYYKVSELDLMMENRVIIKQAI